MWVVFCLFGTRPTLESSQHLYLRWKRVEQCVCACVHARHTNTSKFNTCSQVSAPSESIYTTPRTRCPQGPVIRAAEGRPPFGTSAEEKIFYACKTLPELFYGVLLVFFPVFGCFWMFRQLLMARSLLDLIALPRRVDFRLFTSSKSTSALQTQVVALPRLDLSNPHNVQGWACLRRVIYGRNFAPAVELKMQFYVTITLFLFLISSAANTFGSFATPGVEIPLDFVIVSVMRPTLLSIPIVIQILLAYQINNIPFRYAEELNAQSATCLALAAEEARVDTSQARVEREDRVRDLQDAAGLLSAVAAEIESEAE